MSKSAEESGSSPAQRVSISWHNIQVFGTNSGKKFYECGKKDVPPKEIIKKVSGVVEAGQLLAIMGPSGAGKTSLLNVLTARNLSKVTVKGVVKLNGQVATADTITSLSAYVQQTDLFLPVFTVREQLLFQSHLKMNTKSSKEERNVRINQLLNEFSLEKCADTRIGSSTTFKGISGGETKRLAFASELLTNPSIMFCDEPTSGLDSYMAENIMKSLKTLSSKGRTIICTIHQPSSQVFALFEQLLLMVDGRVAYMGTINNAFNFFSSLGYNCPQNYNPSDFYISQLAFIYGNEVECRDKINKICDNYLNSTYGQQMKSLEEEMTDEVKNGLKMFGNTSRYKVNCCRQFSTVFWRAVLTSIREPQITTIRIIQSIVIAVILGAVYWNQELTQRGIMNINGALFILITTMTMTNTLAVLNTFCEEMPLYFREHHNGLYRVDVYFLSKMFAEIPIFTLIPVIFVSIFYYMVGFNPLFDRFVITVLITILITQCTVSFGYLMSCVSGSVAMAESLAPPLLMPPLLFGGFFMNNASIPKLLVWIKYISWFYYGFEALMINQWKGIDNISCPISPFNSTNASKHCLDSGKAVMGYFDFEEEDLFFDIIMLFVLTIGLRILAFIALFIKSRER